MGFRLSKQWGSVCVVLVTRVIVYGQQLHKGTLVLNPKHEAPESFGQCEAYLAQGVVMCAFPVRYNVAQNPKS